MSDHPPDPLVEVIGLDHIVLRCADVETTLTWYTELLGLAALRVDEWRAGEVPFPSVRIDPGTIIDLFARRDDDPVDDLADGRLDHFCVVIAPTDLEAIKASGRFDVVGGPGTRFGARGDGQSLYIRDPDGAVVELRYYPVAATG